MHSLMAVTSLDTKLLRNKKPTMVFFLKDVIDTFNHVHCGSLVIMHENLFSVCLFSSDTPPYNPYSACENVVHFINKYAPVSLFKHAPAVA